MVVIHLQPLHGKNTLQIVFKHHKFILLRLGGGVLRITPYLALICSDFTEVMKSLKIVLGVRNDVDDMDVFSGHPNYCSLVAQIMTKI